MDEEETTDESRKIERLLATDSLPSRPTDPPPPPPADENLSEIRTVGVERDEGRPFVMFSEPSAYAFLDAIAEEESDDLRSQTSGVFRSQQSADSVGEIIELQSPRSPSSEAPSVIAMATSPPSVADRDQAELLVADQFSCVTPHDDGRVSSTSMSINLDRSRDSVCSNPHEETHQPAEAPPTPAVADDDDLPPPPPPPPLPPPQEPQQQITEETKTEENKVQRPSNTERLSSLVHGYAGSPLLWDTSKLKSDAFGEGDKENAPRLTDAFVATAYSSTLAPSKEESADFARLRHSRGMTTAAPPAEPPPPLPPVDEVMSDRPTVRDIPIHRSVGSSGALASMAAPILPHHGSSTTAWTTTRYDPITGGPQQEEYYRREVMTRTLVTRSTEALSAPPLSRSSPIDRSFNIEPRDEISEEILYKYSRNIEEEERRIRESQEIRRRDEELRRQQIEEQRRRWEQQEAENLERLRRERERMEKQFEDEILQREAIEKQRITRDRKIRQEEENRRRIEWERLEEERRRAEEAELEKRRRLEELEKERLRREKERLEEEERLRMEAERLRLEELERQRLEVSPFQIREFFQRERIERERIEIERLEIERIERIKREQKEKEEKERERQRLEEERLEKERLEAERLERERIELERRERELLEQARREAEERDRERREEEYREMQRREQERRDKEELERAKKEARDRELLRRQREQEEIYRLENLRREQERLEYERIEAIRREEERKEQERREQELLDAARRARERREQERIEDELRERQRQEEERLEKERRLRERLEAQERERQRALEEERERQRLAGLGSAANERRNQRVVEQKREQERIEIERRTKELEEAEKRQQQRRDQERAEEERRLQELELAERRKAELRDREREKERDREEQRRQLESRSRDHLNEMRRSRDHLEERVAEHLRNLRDHEELERKKQNLTSKETLGRLTRPPYYSRENLSTIGGPDVTTKVHREVIERVDRTLWSSDGPIGASDAITDGNDRYGNASRDEDLRRSGRTSKYKAKMEKARRDYFAADPPADGRSSDDLSRRYRGPLLQKFHSGELIGRPDLDGGVSSYARVGPSPYDQEYRALVEKAERQLAAYRQRLSQPALDSSTDDAYRSKSVLDYTVSHQSRRDLPHGDSDAQHSRSKSADYLMDRRLREDVAPPENELRKTADILSKPDSVLLSEHEQRFRKSMDRLSGGPDLYHRQRAAPPTNISQTTATDQGYGSRPYSRQQYEISPSYRRMGSPIGGISFPVGMFDRYKDEIEDMRRSRSSLRQETEMEPAISQEYSREEFSKRDVRTFFGADKLVPGYTVSTIPSDWNLSRDRHSRVVEVADTFIGRNEPKSQYGGRITLEEVLDAIFQETSPTIPDPTVHDASPPPPPNADGPGIYTPNQSLMNRILNEPHLAESLLKNEQLLVQCTNCHKTRSINEARSYYVSCKHCYTYYCSKMCRLTDWERHRDRCSFARINTLCKEVIVKVRHDPETQYHMSKVARDGYRRQGRGSVNIRLISAHSAQMYLKRGWKALVQTEEPDQLLFYYPIQVLVDQRKEPSLIKLCKQYNPQDKFILSVSIIADIERCPETPPPEPFIDNRYSIINKPRSFATDRYGALVPTDV